MITLSDHLKKQHLTHAEFARRAEISLRTLQNALAGKNVSNRTWRKIQVEILTSYPYWNRGE